VCTILGNCNCNEEGVTTPSVACESDESICIYEYL